MNEQHLIRLSIVGTIVGLVMLYFVSINMTSARANIGDITGSFVGNSVTVIGEVNGLYKHKAGHIFFNLKDDTGEIKVVLWDDVVKQLKMNGIDISKVKNGDSIEITGEIIIYKGVLELEPIGSRVKIIT